jgi:hypothetical protein
VKTNGRRYKAHRTRSKRKTNQMPQMIILNLVLVAPNADVFQRVVTTYGYLVGRRPATTVTMKEQVTVIGLNEDSFTEHALEQWYSTFLFAYPQIYFLLNFVHPKLLVYNSSYT